MRKKYIILSIASLVILLDQITKFLITGNFYFCESVPVIKNVFHITYVTNTGTAFSMFAGYGKWLMLVVVAALVIIYVHLMKHRESIPASSLIAFSLILGGGMGNLIDRIFRGAVVDFIDFRIWPVFNVADSAITVGMATIILFSFIRRKNRCVG